MTTKEVKHITGDGEEQTFIRLTADSGKVLTNDGGETVWNCIDIESSDGWTEISDMESNISQSEALTRYANTLTGVNDLDLISAAETLIEQRIKEEQL